MRIGILGGTFDPIHNGHLIIGQYAYEQLALDEIWFLPNGNPPHKDAVVTEQHLKHRITMVDLAIADNHAFRMCLYEAHVERHSYSNLTMAYLQENNPEDEFYFIVGADSLFSLEKWYQFQELLHRCTFVVAVRDQKDVDAVRKQIEYLYTKYGTDIKLLDSPLIEISSSMIRERVIHGRSIRYMVPHEVRSFIERNKLYID